MKIHAFFVLLFFISASAIAEENSQQPQGGGCLPFSDEGYPVIFIGGITPEQRPLVLAAVRIALTQSQSGSVKDPPIFGTIACGVCTPSE